MYSRVATVDWVSFNLTYSCYIMIGFLAVRIVKQTSTQLIIQHSPVLSWLACGILLMIGLSAFAVPVVSSDQGLAVHALAWISVGFSFFLVLSGRTITWIFDREKENLLIKEKFLFSNKVVEYSLQEISDVKIESKVANSDGKELFNNRFGVKLILSGKQPSYLCTDYSLSMSAAQEVVYRVSAFLKA